MFGFHRHHRHHHHGHHGCHRGADDVGEHPGEVSAEGWPGDERGPRGFFFRRRRRFWGRRFGRRSVGGLLAHIGATPAQERVVREEVQQVKALTRELRGELARSRADVATAIGGEEFDPAALEAAFARHDEALRALRTTVIGGLGRIHATLDSAQRARLVALLGGAPAGPPGGPFRSAPRPE